MTLNITSTYHLSVSPKPIDVGTKIPSKVVVPLATIFLAIWLVGGDASPHTRHTPPLDSPLLVSLVNKARIFNYFVTNPIL